MLVHSGHGTCQFNGSLHAPCHLPETSTSPTQFRSVVTGCSGKMMVNLGHGTCQSNWSINAACNLSEKSAAAFSSSRKTVCHTVPCSPSSSRNIKPFLGCQILHKQKCWHEGGALKRGKLSSGVPVTSTVVRQPLLPECKFNEGSEVDGFMEKLSRPELDHTKCVQSSSESLHSECMERKIPVCGCNVSQGHSTAALMRRELLLLASSAAISAASLAGAPLLDFPTAHAFVEEDPASRGIGLGGASDARGRNVIVTGGNSGIGKATAVELARQGMDVVLACRSQERGDAAAADIIAQTGNANVRSMLCDLASLRSVRQFAAEYIETGRPLHVLVNNAGVMATPKMYTQDGFELQFGTNHIGHFALTSLLMDSLVNSASEGQKSRVVVVASKAEQLGSIDFSDLNFDSTRQYNPWAAYAQSKLANILFARELARRAQAQGLPLTANSMHPGIVDTELIRYVLPASVMDARAVAGSTASKFARLIGLKSPEEGAATVVYLASSPQMEGRTGGFYDNLKLEMPSSNARDDALAKRLWSVSEELMGALFSLDSALGVAV